MQGVRTCKDWHKIMYFNVAAAFDIETSSFEIEGKKQACMYLWAFGLNGAAIYGRTWPEFINLLQQLQDILSLSDTKRLVVYVHNLAYEFQFIRCWLEWKYIFALKRYKPVKALCTYGIEFRCSYQLSGYSLAKLGDELQEYKVKKLTGDLDYKLKRHSYTPLTDKELSYQKNDVLVVMAYIQETIERDGNILKIPMTKTGYVRNYTRNACLYSKAHHSKDKKYNKYRDMIKRLELDPETFQQLQRAFAGGFTHANAFCSGKVINNVGSFDFTSSYPAVMIAEKFPMSMPEIIEIHSQEELQHNLMCYCCLFDAEFTNIRPRLFWDHPLSRSKCHGLIEPQEDNGRIVKAARLFTTITEQDFFTLQDFYEWDSMRVANFRRYYRGYLPTDFIKAILKLYQDKTELKGIEGKEVEYLLAKGMINACYGMTVTNPVRPLITYGDGWAEDPPDLETALLKYNKSKKRFLYYPWGVWVTAYARRNLFKGIKAFGTDYVYSDTDSIKATHPEDHAAFIESYNKQITDKLYKACAYHGIDPALTHPKTIKGIEKPLGVWDYEGMYDRFKTLGAKRYLVEQNGQLHLTVSGLNKKIAIPYLNGKYCRNYQDSPANPTNYYYPVFKAFEEGLYIPPEYTGKNTHTYIDEEMEGVLTDYLGTPAYYYEKSAVHLSGADYTLSLSKLYIEYLRGLIIDE